jgi:hypothetical protein
MGGRRLGNVDGLLEVLIAEEALVLDEVLLLAVLIERMAQESARSE